MYVCVCVCVCVCVNVLKAALNFAFPYFRTVMLCTVMLGTVMLCTVMLCTVMLCTVMLCIVMFDGLVEIRLVVELNVWVNFFSF